MAAKKPAKKARTTDQRLASLDKLVRDGFRQTGRRLDGLDSELRRFKKYTEAKFRMVEIEFRGVRKEIAKVDDRIDKMATHLDGFVKLYEALDIELRVMKGQMNCFEERLNRLETAQAS